MKKIKVLCVLLAAVLLCGCANAKKETLAETTQPTEPERTPITTEEELQAALDNGGRVQLDGEIQLTETLVVKGNILDGNGNTVNCQDYNEEDETTGYSVAITSGTLQNIRVVNGYRCICDTKEFSMGNDVRIKNVYADGTTHALSIGRGSREASLYVEDSTLLGWNLVNTKLKTAQFTNCTFGFNNYNEEGKPGTRGNFRNYVDTTLIDCRFENKVDENGKVTKYCIYFNKSTKGVTLYLENCYVGDTLITQDNVSTLLNLKNVKNNNVVVRNSGV